MGKVTGFLELARVAEVALRIARWQSAFTTLGLIAGDRVALGRLLAKAGDDTGAIRELETVLVTSPHHDAAVVELVGPYRRTGRS